MAAGGCSWNSGGRFGRQQGIVVSGGCPRQRRPRGRTTSAPPWPPEELPRALLARSIRYRMRRIQRDSPPALLRPLLLHLAPTAPPPTIFPVAGVRRAPHPTILRANEPHIPPSPHKLPGERRQELLC